jgi:DNA repair exonuclease SbcCD ATPase subunit
LFKKIKELLESGKISETVAGELDSEVSGELKNLRDEASSWRVKYQDLNTKFDSIAKAKDDLEGKLGSIDEQIKKAKEQGKAELANELEAYKKSQSELKSNLEAIQAENQSLLIKSSLQSELSKYKLIDNDVVMAVLGSKVGIKDGQVTYKDGENSLSLSDGIKGFLESKPHLLSAQGQNGSGNEGGGYGGGNVAKSKMSDLERFDFIKKHGSEAYKNLKG